MSQEAYLRRYGHVADPWSLTPKRWFGLIKAIAEIVKRENG